MAGHPQGTRTSRVARSETHVEIYAVDGTIESVPVAYVS